LFGNELADRFINDDGRCRDCRSVLRRAILASRERLMRRERKARFVVARHRQGK
jgi:hypothetical protein